LTSFCCFHSQPGDGKAYSPKFPKPKDEGWFFVVGDSDTNELHALKRVGAVRKVDTHITLVFYTPEKEGRKTFTLYVMSDSYLGLDQQYDLHLEIIAPLTGDCVGDDNDDDIYQSD